MATQTRSFDGQYWTAKTLAAYLAVSEKAVYKWVSEGKIPYTKIGSALRFKKSSIDQFLETRQYLPRELQQSSRKN